MVEPYGTVRRYADAWAADDLAAVIDRYADAFVLHYFGESPPAGDHVGDPAADEFTNAAVGAAAQGGPDEAPGPAARRCAGARPRRRTPTEATRHHLTPRAGINDTAERATNTNQTAAKAAAERHACRSR